MTNMIVNLSFESVSNLVTSIDAVGAQVVQLSYIGAAMMGMICLWAFVQTLRT